MAFAFVDLHGSAAEQASSTSLVLSVASTISAGSLAILQVVTDDLDAVDGDTTLMSVADSQGNTWTRAAERTASTSDISIGVFYSVLDTELGTSDTVTLTLNTAVTAKAARLSSYSIDATAVQVDDSVTGQGISGSQSTDITSLSDVEHLLLGTAAQGYQQFGTWTEDPDYTTRGNQVASGSSGSASVVVRSSSRIAQVTSDTWATSWTTPSVHAQALVSFSELGSSSSTYTLDANSGTFSLTGTDATLTGPDNTLTADPGTFGISGTAATLLHTSTVDGDAGVFEFTGTDATLTYTPAVGGTLTADPGAFAMTGTAATLQLTRRLTADPGSFVMRGTAVTFSPETTTPQPSDYYYKRRRRVAVILRRA